MADYSREVTPLLSPASAISSSFSSELQEEGADMSQWDADLSRLQLCRRLYLKPSYKLRVVKSGGAMLILLWSTLVFGYFGTIENAMSTFTLTGGIKPYAGIIMNSYQALNMVLLYPLAGWLADVYIGRYRLVRWSMWIMWVTMVMMTTLLIVNHCYRDNQSLSYAIHYGVFPLATILMNIGLAGFKANIIPLGVDQLQEASSEQLSSFIHWFIWTLFLSAALDTILVTYVPLSDKELLLVQSVFQTACLSIAISSDYIFQDCLTIEPGNQNPLQTVYKVLNYAAKNKLPQMRSAFTYGEIPSRIDLAKTKYGGTFTTEQVEDVKAFLRIILVLFALFGYFVDNVAAFRVSRLLSEHLTVISGHGSEAQNRAKYSNSTFNINSAIIVLFTLVSIPFYELLIHPMLHKYTPSMLKRTGFGMVLMVASLCVQMALDITAHALAQESAQCMFYTDYSMNRTTTYGNLRVWMYIPAFLNAIALIMVLVGIFEFICAQSPYAMKGLLIGVFYCSNGIFLALGELIELAFILAYHSRDKYQTFPTCSFWYYLLSIIIAVLGIAVFSLVARGYKKRRRDEIMFEQTVAERYYERNLINSITA